MARVIKNIFQLRRGLHDKWIEENPILSEGEPAFETDTFHLKIGDGKTAYQALPYIGEDWSEGKDGTGIESITYKGEDESGGNIYTVLLTDGTSYDITAPKGAKGDKGDAGGSGQAVLYTEQSLTEDQQTQALENIRAVDKYNGLKRYDVEYQNSRGVTIKNTIYTNGVLTQPEELSTETEIGMAWARFNSWLGLTLSVNPSSESYYIKAIAAIADFGCFGNDFWETTSDTSRIFTKTPEKLPDRYTCIYSYSADTKTIWAKKYYETSRYEVGYSIKTNKFTNYAIYFGTPIQPTAVKADAIPDVMQFQMKTDPTSDMQVATKKYVDDTAAQAGGGTDHSKLTNRDKADQHPTSAITGLAEKLQEVDTMLVQRVETDDFGLIQGVNYPFTNPDIPAKQKQLLIQRLMAGLYNQGIHFRVFSTSPMVDVVYYVTSATAKSEADYSITAETVKPDGTPVVMTITPNDVTIEERTAVFYVDIVGTYPDYSYADESFNVTQIAAAYKAGKTVLLRHISEKTGVEGATVDAMYTLSAADTYDAEYTFFRLAAGPVQIEAVVLQPFVGITAYRMELAAVDDIPDIPSALPNPNALTLNVGDETTIYDGSEAKELTIPTADNTLGLTSATVGQIAKITAVDADGVPTAWEPVDMPSGGGGGNGDTDVTPELALAGEAAPRKVAENTYIAPKKTIMFLATSDGTLTVSNVSSFSYQYVNLSLGDLVNNEPLYVITSIENGFQVSLNPEYTAGTHFSNGWFAFKATIEKGKTYTLRYKFTVDTYVFLVKSLDTADKMNSGKTLLTQDVSAGVSTTTFTAEDDFVGIRFAPSSLPVDLTEITFVEGDTPADYDPNYSDKVRTISVVNGERYYLTNVLNKKVIGPGAFYEAPYAIIAVNGLTPSSDGSIKTYATDKTFVNFGDSIWTFGASTGGIGTISDYMESICGGTWHNIATGGSTMATRPGSYAGTYDAFDFHALADCVASQDFTTPKGATSGLTSNIANVDNITWDDVDVITIAYGTNDLAFGGTVDNAENLYDKATVCGALRYGIKTIAAAYPNINFMVLGVIYRSADSVSLSDISVMNKALKEASEMMGAEYVPMIGINAGNSGTYLYDGTHPNAEGKEAIAKCLAKHIVNI